MRHGRQHDLASASKRMPAPLVQDDAIELGRGSGKVLRSRNSVLARLNREQFSKIDHRHYISATVLPYLTGVCSAEIAVANMPAPITHGAYAIEALETSPGRWRARLAYHRRKIKIPINKNETAEIETSGMESLSAADAIEVVKEMIDGGIATGGMT
jgi:hypothetical protein